MLTELKSEWDWEPEFLQARIQIELEIQGIFGDLVWHLVKSQVMIKAMNEMVYDELENTDHAY